MMPDFTLITAGLSSVKIAMDIAKGIRESGISLEKAEVKLQLAELLSSLADAKISLVETQELLDAKDKEIKALTEALEIKAKLVRRHESYYQTGEDGEPTGDPCCSRCWEVDHRLVHLGKAPRPGAMSFCPACQTVFQRQPIITPGADVTA